jgi:Cu-processing system permease protein
MARRELGEALRSRWFVLYSAVFAALGLGVSLVSSGATSGGGGGGGELAGFGRTTAGLMNLVLLIVPLMALNAGAGSIAGERERGTLSFLLAQPIRRWELLLAKFVALGLALSCSITLGFGLCAAVIAVRGGSASAGGFLLLSTLAVALALGMLGVGLLISVTARRTAAATGLAIFTWLLLVFGTDLGLMGGALATRLSIRGMFHLAVLSPLQTFKMWALQGVDASLDVLGPVGLYAQTVYGSSLTGWFAAVLAAWVVVPMMLAVIVFARRNP